MPTYNSRIYYIALSETKQALDEWIPFSWKLKKTRINLRRYIKIRYYNSQQELGFGDSAFFLLFFVSYPKLTEVNTVNVTYITLGILIIHCNGYGKIFHL